MLEVIIPIVFCIEFIVTVFLSLSYQRLIAYALLAIFLALLIMFSLAGQLDSIYILLLIGAAAAWARITAIPVVRHRAGPTLLSLHRADAWMSNVVGVSSLIFAAFLLGLALGQNSSGDIDRIRSSFQTAYLGIGFLSIGALHVVQGLFGDSFREKGIVLNSGATVPWKEVESFAWEGYQHNHLRIDLRDGERGLRWITIPVRTSDKEAADRFLSKRVQRGARPSEPIPSST